MKRFFPSIISIFVLSVFFFNSPTTLALRATRLLDKAYISSQCLVLCADAGSCKETLCKNVDIIQSGFQKTHSEEVDVYPSGQIAIYVSRNKGGDAPYGGFDPKVDAYFYPQDGTEPVAIGDGLQVYGPGKIRFSFDQPYDDLYRREMNFRIIVWFYPHNQSDLDNFRLKKQFDLRDFEQFKSDTARNVSSLCSELQNDPAAPDACVSAGVVRARQLTQQSEFYVNQSLTNKSKPIFLLDKKSVAAFTNQPVGIDIVSLEDPDGQCDDFQYLWDNTSGQHLNFITDDLGNVTFVPSSAGEYRIRFRVRENCPGSTLTSDPTFIDIHVADRTTLFPDLKPNHFYREFLLDLYSLGVIRGYPDGTVKPDKLVSRAEFLKMLFETARVEVPITAFSYAFPDVVDGQWYAPYVHYAKNLGVIDGYPDNYFRPNYPVNLAEALKIMLQITDIPLKENLDIWFGDVDSTDWYSRYFSTAFREGILDDVQIRQNVYPARLLTRGEVAKLLVRTFIRPVNRINQVNVNKLR